MNIFTKIFPTQKNKKSVPTNGKIVIYLDSEYKKCIQVHPQTVDSYLKQSEFEQDQFLYLVFKHRKTNQVMLKRKLHHFQHLEDVLSEVNTMGGADKQKGEYPQYMGNIIVGYNTERNMVPKINAITALNQNLKFLRSGALVKYSDTRGIFEECHLKLYHDYLTYYELKSKQKKVSFLPLENASVQMVSEKKHIFTVKDKFKSIMFKTSSKQDMIGWLLTINQAIRVRNAQIYMNELDQKLSRKIKDKLTAYQNRCNSIRTSNRTILLDEIGRKTLREYFKKNSQSLKQNYKEDPENKEKEKQYLVDIKLLTTIQTYLYMCKVRREKGEQESEPIIESIRQILKQVRIFLPEHFKDKDFESKQQVVKAIQEIMKYLDEKYRKILIQKKHLHHSFQTCLVNQYKQKSRIPVQSLFGSQMNIN